MTQPALPQQLLIAQAAGLVNTEKAFPLGAPPIPLAATLLSIASALPMTGWPVPGQAGLPFPTLPAPLGTTPTVVAAFAPQAPRGLLYNQYRPEDILARRTGLG